MASTTKLLKDKQKCLCCNLHTMPHYHNPLQIECGMLSAKELVRKLKECKEEEDEKGDDEAQEQKDLGTSGWDWRAGTEGERKKQLNQERYHLNISTDAN